MVDAEEDVAAGLEIPEGTPVLELVRLRSAGGEPIAKMTNYLPERLVRFDADDLADHGLYDLIRRQGDHAALGHADAGRPHRHRGRSRGCSRRAAAER